MADNDDMYVTKRNGKLEPVAFDKILQRIKKVGTEVNIKINYTALSMKVIDQLYNKISTTQIDELTSEQCASMASTHPDYNVLAGRITVSNHHKNTEASFTKVMTQLYHFKDIHGNNRPLLSKELYQSITALGNKKLNGLCDYSRDYLIDYFGFKTLERSYLMKINKKVVERPQHMWLRVALGIHGTNWDKVVETYEYMSQKYFTHATPTLFNAGTPYPQLSSCYLMSMEEDSIDGIFNTLKDCALISKWAGGIGLHIHNIRATGSQINGTNGTSNGIVPMLKVFNNTAKYVDQCVHPETMIYTTHGPKEIQNCTTGETSIFNQLGETEIIQNVLEHSYEGEILSIETMHSLFPLQITPMHPLYVLQGQPKGLNFKVIKNRLDKNICQLEWIDARELTTDDMVVYPIPTHAIDNHLITNDDCYMYGIILGDGCMNNNNDTGYVSVHTMNKLHIREFIEKYFQNKLVDYKVSVHENTTRIRWNRTIHLPFRYNDFYDENKTKRVHHRFLNLPVEKSKYIVKGLLDTDGCNHEELVFDSTSLNLIQSLKFICLKMGILTSGYTCDRIGQSHVSDHGIIENKELNYCLRIPKTNEICELMNMEYNEKQFFKFFRYHNYLLSRIQNITTKQYSGVLYDLQMQTQHDYLLETGLVHNGGGKRNGSFAIYLEPWHADIEMFLQMRKNHGDEELKARDLFYALWVPDLFMERVKTNQHWTLMCPYECPGLSDVYGEEFKTLYEKYENEQKGRKFIPARDLWLQILDAQMETGTPYLLYKDACNQKSNQKNLGTIKSSNLCVAPETIILTEDGQYPIYSLWAGNYPESEAAKHKTTKIWNGETFREVEIVKTGIDQDLMEVFTNDGMSLVCTPYHKFYVQENNTIVTKEAKDLLANDILETCHSWPILDGVESMDRDTAIELGIDTGIKSIRLEDIVSTNLFVPLYYKLQSKLDWLAGFLEPYVCDLNTTLEKFLYIQCKSLVFLQNLKLLLQTCGINTIIKKNDILYNLILSVVQLKKLIQTGLVLSQPYVVDTTISEADIASHYMNPEIRVKYAQKLSRKDDTYCFTEPDKHAGIFNGIRTSQCTEIIEYSDNKETAVCNLASIALPAFIEETDNGPVFNYTKLHEVTKVVTSNLNRIIDVNYYPTEKTRISNMRHRPIGIGVQGLADVFLRLGLSFSCTESRQINKDIFETIYHASLEKSCELACEEGSYETFEGSPASKGILQFDMWNVDPGNTRYDWNDLKQNIQTKGLRNSLLVAPMPTASTSQILGYNECIEPITSNIYTRRTIAGEFIMVNKYLMNELLSLDMWNESLKNHMVANNGSIQSLETIPVEIRNKYKTVWEIPMRDLIDMSADRGAYICQSQSLNLWLEDPDYKTMTSMHFYSWSKGLKTGIYYLRRRPRHQAQQFTIEPEMRKQNANSHTPLEGTCEMCSA
jgi:ribonucleoside-diphosphate reductase alpha chain